MDSINDFFALLTGSGMIMAVAGVLMGVLCPAAVIGGLVLLFVRGRRKAENLRQAAASWPATTGRVLRSFVDVSKHHSSESGTSTSYTPKIIYEYFVDGMLYRNDRLNVGGPMIKVKNYMAEQAVVDRYPEGSSVTVYYNPENPQESLLER